MKLNDLMNENTQDPYIVMVGTPESTTLVFVIGSPAVADNFGDVVEEIEGGYGSWTGFLSQLPQQTQQQIISKNPVPHSQPIDVDDLPDDIDDDDVIDLVDSKSKVYIEGSIKELTSN